ncbi:MAG: hypothetical protein HY720_23565 [Planctomycetes bacterium]|nr:hypothetical protein [Planctomycetota bacterium]
MRRLSSLSGKPFAEDYARVSGAGPLELELERVWPLAGALLALHDTDAEPRRLCLFFPEPRGILMKRLRSAGNAEELAPLFGADLDWDYRHERDGVLVVASYAAGEPAEALGDRVVGLAETLAKVDKKSLARWVAKFVSSQDVAPGAAGE